MQVTCVNNHSDGDFLTIGKVYNVVKEDGMLYHVINDEDYESCYMKSQFVVGTTLPDGEVSDNKPIDSHYNFTYELSVDDIDAGYIKLDPYFVSKEWKLGKRDDSGILFHCLKTIARLGDKNSREREITALYKQVRRLAELEGVHLD